MDEDQLIEASRLQREALDKARRKIAAQQEGDDYHEPNESGFTIHPVRSRTADKIDGYDRDDLGESPDY